MTAAERAKQMREFAEALYRHCVMSEQAGLVKKRPRKAERGSTHAVDQIGAFQRHQ